MKDVPVDLESILLYSTMLTKMFGSSNFYVDLLNACSIFLLLLLILNKNKMFHNIYLLDALVLKLYNKDGIGENLDLPTDVSRRIVYIYTRVAQEYLRLICCMYIVIRCDLIANIFDKLSTSCFNLVQQFQLLLLGYANMSTEEPDFCSQHR